MTATAKAAPMREDVTQAKDGSAADLIATLERLIMLTPRSANARDAQDLHCSVRAIAESAIERHRLAHIARPDAGDDKAEIERLRGLLIDPGTPPWEDARAVLVAELRKSGFDRNADYVASAHGCMVPSDIALNLIAQAARRPDAGDEDVERVARAIGTVIAGRPIDPLDEPEKFDFYYGTIARAALAAMREGVDAGMVARLREALSAEDDYWAASRNLAAAFARTRPQAQAIFDAATKRREQARAALSPEQPR